MNTCLLFFYVEIQTLKSSCVIESFAELYKNIHDYQKHLIKMNVQHPQLKPKLRKYQEDAVRWMIQREEKSIEDGMLIIHYVNHFFNDH